MPVIVIRRVIVVGIEHDNLIHAGRVRIDRMNMQVAKAQGEIALLLGSDVLLAQEHHLMAQHRVIQLFKLVVAQRAGDVDAGYLRANIRPQRGDT